MYYRFGFNGKEKDPEGLWGKSAHYDYGFRIYDPTYARFLSVDPLTRGYPMLTPYQFSSNRPIDGIDVDGLEFMDADQSLINITSGGVFLKLENASFFTNSKARSSHGIIDMENRTVDNSFPLSVTSNGIDYSQVINEIKTHRNSLAAPLNKNEAINRIQYDDPITGQPRDRKNKSRFSGNSKQRRKQRRRILHSGNQPGGVKNLPSKVGRAGTVGILVGAAGIILNEYANSTITGDFGTAINQLKTAGIESLQLLLSNRDLIPDKFLDNNYFNELHNYLFQGTLVLEHDEDTRTQLETIGNLILLQAGKLNCADCSDFDSNDPVVREFFQRNNKRSKN